MGFNLSTCKMVIATHADADHIQGLAHAKEMLKTKVAAHPLSKEPLETGDEILTYATIKAQDFSIPMPCCKVDLLLNDGDTIAVGNQKLQVCHTPAHTADQITFNIGTLLSSAHTTYKHTHCS